MFHEDSLGQIICEQRSMIDDLDRTLKELLVRELPSSLVKPDSISFDTPDNEFVTRKLQPPAINLFLYDMRENQELRNNEWSIERQTNGTATKQRPTIRVDCSYLITAWCSDGQQSYLDEHLLLGEVMKVLLRHPTIPAEVLQGSLKGQEPPLRTAALRPSPMQSTTEFWQAMGGKPKATLNYTVTIAVTAHEAIETVPLVIDKRI